MYETLGAQKLSQVVKKGGVYFDCHLFAHAFSMRRFVQKMFVYDYPWISFLSIIQIIGR